MHYTLYKMWPNMVELWCPYINPVTIVCDWLGFSFCFCFVFCCCCGFCGFLLFFWGGVGGVLGGFFWFFFWGGEGGGGFKRTPYINSGTDRLSGSLNVTSATENCQNAMHSATYIYLPFADSALLMESKECSLAHILKMICPTKIGQRLRLSRNKPG